MNRIYQVIWSSVKDCYVVVSENAGRHGKKKAVHLAPSTTKRTMLAMSLGAAVLFGSAASASAATGKVIGGGGIESGDTSSAKGEDATISGGFVNHAERNYSSVSGGSKNHAKGTNSSVSGGSDNQAFGEDSSVSGGGQNKATGKGASVAGGTQNQAGGEFSTVSGGSGNKAFGWGSIVIGGTGNVTGKVAVDAKGDPLKDANDNQYPADKDSDPFFRIGQDSVAIGGVSSSVQGNYSVGIAGGSTSAKAASGLAAGKQATVTMANGVAIGYESTASVIDASRTADTEGRIVSFGHQAGDVYYTVDYQNHTVTENKYDSAAYNRLVNVADGIDDHDVVVMEQLKALASQGMNFQGNDTTTSVHLNQGGTLLLQGSGTKADEEYSTQNVKVLTDADHQRLSIALDKNPDFDSVTAGGVKMGTQTDGNDTTKSGNYVTGLDNKTWTVGQTQPVDGRAATENQLKSVSDVVNSNKTQITTNTNNIAKGLNFSASNKVDGAYKTVNRALGSTVAVRANDAQDGHTYKTDNLTTEIDDNGIITVKMDT